MIHSVIGNDTHSGGDGDLCRFGRGMHASHNSVIFLEQQVRHSNWPCLTSCVTIAMKCGPLHLAQGEKH